jgi:DNA-binding response OmpR family regulator
MASPSVDDVTRAFVRVVRRQLENGERVVLPGLGTFEPETPPTRTERPTVLFAMEDDVSVELLADRLEREDVTTVRVDDGQNALRQLDESTFGALVAETRLRGRTGFELLRTLPHLNPAVILLGRRGNDAEVVQAFELGAADYITRPFAPEVAAARILRFLRPPHRGSTSDSNYR